ncbi:DNA primase TraC [Halomonas sp. THAF5a]|uniref:PriCT-2 domain-containing protein n=1 Tax=Halomonas sp. THAF5a TaxID=2587844 RepID=UPI001267E443|nr:PriCT-2 domain-containing protein [Halomonas sp. THAF5a]QFU01256.1 DNA primase TraC [Halomonas sp. THAF5a]
MQHDPLTLDELRLALQHIAADDRETWVSIGNACKTEYGDDGFAAWDEWSQQAASYKAADAKSVWRSLTPGHVHLGTIIKLAADGGWKRERREMSAEYLRRLKAEAEERRRRAAEAVEADQAKLERMREAVAEACQRVFEQHLQDHGASPYLDRKGVGAYGVLFPRRSLVVNVDSLRERVDVWAGQETRQFWADVPKPRPDHLHFFHVRQGDLVVPLRDAGGKLWALQTINHLGTKLFPRFGRKMGCFHLIDRAGDAVPPVVAVAEGYATAASVHEATGWPVAVALDLGNMARVAQLVRQMFPQSQLILCGDDDPETKDNPGRAKTEALAEKLGCAVAFPSMEAA